MIGRERERVRKRDGARDSRDFFYYLFTAVNYLIQMTINGD